MSEPTSSMSSAALQLNASTSVPPLRAAAKKVLHLINGEFYAGAERVQDLLGMNLPEFGFEVGYVCVKADRFAPLRESQEVPLWEVPVRHPWDRRAIQRIARIAAEEGYDLLHSHTPRSYWAALGVAALAGLPLVHTIHDVSLANPSGMVRRVFNRYLKAELARADLVIAVSPATLSIARRYRLGARRVLIRNGVPSAGAFRRRPLPTRWTVGTVALWRPSKGIQVIIAALDRLRSAQRKVRLRIVGRFETSQYEREIHGLVDSLQLGDSVDFVGFTRDVSAELRQLDLFVLASTSPEGLPMVLLEAMAQGLPVIGSDVAGISDVIRDGLDGRLFAAGNHRALAAAIDDFLQGQTDWQQIRYAAYSRHKIEFSARRMADQTADAYRCLLGESASAAARPEKDPRRSAG